MWHERNPRTTDTGWFVPVEGGKFHPKMLDARRKALSGVYAIRDAETGEVLYVGESHTGKLYGTLSRHLQHWYGKSAGKTYQPERIEVRYMRTSGATAPDWQQRWIERLLPSDNLYLSPREMDEEEAPF